MSKCTMQQENTYAILAQAKAIFHYLFLYSGVVNSGLIRMRSIYLVYLIENRF